MFRQSPLPGRESWITTSGARETAEKALESLIEELRGLESMASEAAALLEKSGKDVGDWEEEKQINRSIMIALAGRNLRKDLGQSRWDSSSHEAAPEREAVQLRRAIRAYQTVGRREQDVWWLEDEYAAPVRDLLRPFEGDVRMAGPQQEVTCASTGNSGECKVANTRAAMTGSTDAVHLKGDRFPPQGVPEPGMACVSDSARTLAAALVRTAAFRCLRDVSFLGGIDYLSPLPGKSYSPRKASCSRHEHSLGVGRLFSLYAGISGTSEYLTKLGLAAALLHDIGHCIGKIVAPPAVMMMREECCRHRIVSLLNMDP